MFSITFHKFSPFLIYLVIIPFPYLFICLLWPGIYARSTSTVFFLTIISFPIFPPIGIFSFWFVFVFVCRASIKILKGSDTSPRRAASCHARYRCIIQKCFPRTYSSTDGGGLSHQLSALAIKSPNADAEHLSRIRLRNSVYVRISRLESSTRCINGVRSMCLAFAFAFAIELPIARTRFRFRFRFRCRCRLGFSLLVNLVKHLTFMV